MQTIILEALNCAFKAEIEHTFATLSRELKNRGGPDKAAEVLCERIDNLRLFHAAVLDQLDVGET